MNRRLNKVSDETEINLSPMIDMVFILLIFFIVTTVFVEEVGVEIVEPPKSIAEDLEKNSILFGITADNKIVYGGKEIEAQNVRVIVRRLLKDGIKPVIIKGHMQCSHETYQSVFREAKNGGAKIIHYTQHNNT